MFQRFFILAVTLLAFPAFSAQAANDKPFVIPELKEWRGGEGTLTVTDATRIVYPAGDAGLQNVAEMLSADILKRFGIRTETTADKGRPGDIVLSLKADKRLGDEGYALRIEKRAEATAPTVTGVYWATRTLLQMAESFAGEGMQLPRGTVRDWPDYALRGCMLDCGRKYIPLAYLKDYVEIMSYYKMNLLQIHLNDNGFKQFFNDDWDRTYAAFRMESETFPGLAAEDGHYSKADFRDFQKGAAARFVEILPEIDVPAHSLAFVHYKPELGSNEYGRDHLDIMKPETYDFLDALFAEYLEGDDPVFVGPRVSIGTDEYSNRDRKVVEQFRAMTDRYIRYVESFGKEACIWGSLTHAAGETPVKVDGVWMQAWSNGYAHPREMADLGYRLISIPDGLVYIVPAAGYYYDYLNIRYLYEQWTPADINGVRFPERDPAIAGGMFAVWNDHPGNGISTGDIHHRAFPALQTLAAKCWSGTSASVPFEVFDARRQQLSEAPGVYRMGRHVPAGGDDFRLFWSADTLAPGHTGPFERVGYDYLVEFDIEGCDEQPGTELFRSEEAVFYLSDPVSGMLGFARDGYLFTFRHRIDAGEKMHIGIAGDSRSTRLYIDGRLADELVRGFRWYSEKARTGYVPTLVFPLRSTGEFRSRITNFTAKQK